MAQKTTTIALSTVEINHLSAALSDAQAAHDRQFGRPNAALGRVQAKILKATAAATEEEPTGEPEKADDDEPDADS